MSDDIRRQPRRKTEHRIEVEDTLSGLLLGSISDLSETGMMMVSRVPIGQESLFQCLLHFPPALQLGAPMAVGCQELWSETSTLDGVTVVGFRFIDITHEDRQRLKQWVHEPGSRYA